MQERFPDPPANPPAPQDPLSALLKASAGGDAQAFEKFYDATVGEALALASQLTGERLEDLLTATYLRAWNDVAGFDPARCNALDWLRAIVRQLAGEPS